MQSDMSDSSGPMTQRVNSLTDAATVPDTRGKHRIQAELKRLEQETRFIEEELEQLDKVEKASTECKEMMSYVENRARPATATNKWSIESIMGAMVRKA